jgi:hypothetical protein
MERAIVNSIESCEHVKDLKANEQQIQPVKIEAILGEKCVGAQTRSSEGEKNPELKELPSHLKDVFLSKDA